MGYVDGVVASRQELLAAAELSAIAITLIALVVFVGLIVLFYFVPIGLWITAIFSGVRVGIGTLIGMRLRKVPPAEIIRPLISATKAGLDLNIGQMEAHYLAGESPPDIAAALDALTVEEQVLTFRMLPRDVAVDVFGYLPFDQQEQLLCAMAREDVAAILNEMALDDRTTLLDELPATITQQVRRPR